MLVFVLTFVVMLLFQPLLARLIRLLAGLPLVLLILLALKLLPVLCLTSV